MTKWILTAEADKIQHFVFRSAHLREVVGGSQLLTRFCTQAAPELLDRHGGSAEDILVADGGSFSILFDSPEKALRFGRALAQLYWESTGSTLTVAKPVEWSGAFDDANEEARKALALAKREGFPASAPQHLPYAAFCASCGTGLAYMHEALHDDERPNYICPSCRAKADERREEGSEFLLKFKQAVVQEEAQKFSWPSEAEHLARDWDPRNYVAYMVADGNGMGMVFSECSDPETLHQLSQRLTEVLRDSLAEPTKLLMARAPESQRWRVPALPLILGGDDVFILLPAPYALDFARRFCRTYEERMGQALKKLGLGAKAKPTMAAAVVICKSKYPHTLVHKYGEDLLKAAKRLSKAVALDGTARSIVHFDVILGGRLAKAKAEVKFRAGLGPYWVTKEGDKDLLSQLGLSLDRLIGHRYNLRVLPMRRLAQLRVLFAPGQLPRNENGDLALWHARLNRIMGRVARSPTQMETLDNTLGELGGGELGYWYSVSRPGPKEQPFWGHGLPDLLEMWDFSLDLDRDRSEYEAREV